MNMLVEFEPGLGPGLLVLARMERELSAMPPPDFATLYSIH